MSLWTKGKLTRTLGCPAKREVNGEMFDGWIADIAQGTDSGETFYLVKYADGDIEHLTKEDVVQCVVLAANERKAHGGQLAALHRRFPVAR